jgi:hypothetical protein
MKYSSELIRAVALWQKGWKGDPDLKQKLTSNLLAQSKEIPIDAKKKPAHVIAYFFLVKKKSASFS